MSVVITWEDYVLKVNRLYLYHLNYEITTKVNNLTEGKILISIN